MEIEQEIKNLVIARLKTLPEDKSVSVGSEGDFTKDELIQHVEDNDEFGIYVIEVEMNFLHYIKEGLFHD